MAGADASPTLDRQCRATTEGSAHSTQTMKPAWSVYAWPPVLWQAERAAELHFLHLGTRVVNTGHRMFPSTGQTLWGVPSPEGEAGMAWDWVLLSQGIVAMADPLSVITNVRFIGPEGDVLTAWQAARHLNEIVHSLHWQDEVERALNQSPHSLQ